MRRQLVDAIDICMQEMDSGTDLQTSLGLYPELETELRPILEAHYYARMIAVPGPSRSASDQSRTQMLAQAHEARREPKLRSFWLPRVAEVVLAFVVVLVFAGGGIWTASANAVPGDPLYSIKLALEDVSLKFAPSRSLKTSLEESYKDRRVEEAQKLLTLGREEEIIFEGEVIVLDTDTFMIEGMTISLTETTEIIGSFREGDRVEIKAVIRDGTLIEAYTVRLRSYWLVDTLESMEDGIWQVGDTQLRIDEFTIIGESLNIGDRVVVIVEVDEDELDYAQSIHLAPLETPGPTSTPTPPPDLTPSVTPTPEGQGKQIFGIVRRMELDYWRIGLQNVLITGETVIEDEINIGEFVRVDTILLWDGTLVALKIEAGTSPTREPADRTRTPFITPDTTGEPTETPGGEDNESIHFTGVLQSKFAMQWRIDNQFVRINDNTEIIGEPQVGDLVDVIAVERAFGGLVARRIEVVGE
jgi:hypothetical protein